MEFGVVTSVLGIVEQQLIHQPHPCLIHHLPAHTHIIIQSLSQKLHFLRDYLRDSDPHEAQKLLREGIIIMRDVAGEAEDKIQSKLSDVYLAAENSKLQGEQAASSISVEAACEDLHQTLQQVVKDIESVEVHIRDHLQHQQITLSDDASSSSTPSSSSQLARFPIRDEMIGFREEFQEIIVSICHREGYREERKVISIVGMGGAGKTTLARQVYEDPVINRFDIQAWVTVSQEFSRRQVLISLLRCIVSLTNEEISQSLDDQLEERLYKCLKGRRYFIVIDDIWSTRVWDDIRRYFPNDDIESLVLITTRVQQVAEYASSSEAFIYHIRFLDPVESWNLFASKVFIALPELEPIGRKIVEKCGGLPLTIVVIAGMLANVEKSPEHWQDFAQNINSTLMEMGSDSVSGVLALSYDNLPAYLRTCFLYLATFPEDSDIDVKKLMQLWVAEGFLEAKKGKSLEEVAMDYLYDLIHRNLVLVAKQSFDGKIKSCRLYDLLRNFCLRKAQEENMLVVSDDYHDDLVVGTQQSSKLGCRWMSCQSHRWPITPSTSFKYNWGKIRSLLYFGKDLYLQECSFIFSCLKLLRVLDLSLIKYWNGIPSEIVNLIHLRYLALTTAGSLSDFQLFKLPSLQTLILSSWMEECHLQLPSDILDLPWLRHVHLDKGSSLDLPSSVQENLQTLFWLKVSGWDSKPLDFTRVPNLKELGIYIEGQVSNDALDSLTQLHQLEKLKFEVGRVESFSLPVSFPPNIKKLTFCKTYLPWEEMDVIGKLPNLEVLKLKDFAFCGSEWEPSEGGFQKLKLFLIAHTDLKHWCASSEHFPCLKRLVLKYCWNLVNIPIEFAEIFTLESIELESCCSSLATSAEEIKEVRKDYGSNDFPVRKLGIKDKMSEAESETEEVDSEDKISED